MEGSFFQQPANRDVIWHVLIRQHLFDRDGLALVLTCKFLYSLTTPVTRMQMRAGLRRWMSPKQWKKFKRPCETCTHPKKFHFIKHLCPLEPYTCGIDCRHASTFQMVKPWLLLGGSKLTGICCAHCRGAIDSARAFATRSCALCGIYCHNCDLNECPGCNQLYRGRDHVCAADVDRLACLAQGAQYFSHFTDRSVYTLEKHDAPLAMVTGVFGNGTRFMWVLVPDKRRIPPIARGKCDYVLLVDKELNVLVHYDHDNHLYGKYHICSSIKPRPCVVCFQTIAGKNGRFCGRACKIKYASQ